LEKRFPIEWVKGDGFLDYLENREERNRKARLLEETRITGSICPYCESMHVIKAGNAFRCKECGKYWRKKGYI
jgi:ribosomal protein L37AE/L43A